MITVVLGGTRSGKSLVAERLAAATTDHVTYVATARVDPDDADHGARVEAHRVRRPTEWSTVECPDPAILPNVLTDLGGTVLVDSLGTWLSGHHDLHADTSELVRALTSRVGHTIVVSEEVGMAPHAPTELGRRFADQLGLVNQAVAAVADRAYLVVAGRAVELLGPGEPSC